VPNSPAIPLPTTVYSRKIPLPEVRPGIIQAADITYIFDARMQISRAENRFFPCRQGNVDEVSKSRDPRK